MPHYENATVTNEPDLAEQSQIFQEAAGHHGSISSAMERYGGDISKCPYLQSLGSAGVALVEQLQAAEKDPNRGPTIAEVLAAKKAEREAVAPNSDPELVATHTIKQESTSRLGTLQNKPEEPAEIARQVIHTQQEQAFFSSTADESQSEITKSTGETTQAPLNPVIIEFQKQDSEQLAIIGLAEQEKTEKLILTELTKTTAQPSTDRSVRQREASKKTRSIAPKTTEVINRSEKPIQTAPDISAITPPKETIRQTNTRPENPLSPAESKPKAQNKPLKPRVDRDGVPNEIVSPPITETEGNQVYTEIIPSTIEPAQTPQEVETELTLTPNVINIEAELSPIEVSSPEPADTLHETILGFFELDPSRLTDRPETPNEKISNESLSTREQAEDGVVKRVAAMEKPEILVATEIIEQIQHITKSTEKDLAPTEIAAAKEEMGALCERLFRLMNVDIEKAKLQTMIDELISEPAKSNEIEDTPHSREKGTLEQKIDAKAKITHYLLAAMRANQYFSRLGKLLLKDHVLMSPKAV